MIKELLEHYPRYHHLVASAQLVLAMFGMGLVTRPRAFVEIVLEPKPMLVGVLYQLIGIPVLTVAMLLVIALPPEIAVGFLMVSAMPGGSMSNVYTYLGKGNVALSVALTGVMTLLALLSAPLILRLFAAEHMPPEIVMPVGTIMREILLFLLLPLGAGMVLGRAIPLSWALNGSKWLVRASLLVLVILVVGSIGSGHIEVGSYGSRIPIVVLLYCLIIQILILRGSRHVLKFSHADSTALGIESSMKNTSLGVLIGASLFAMEGENAAFGGGVLFVLLLYGGISLGVAAVPAIAGIRQRRVEDKAEAMRRAGLEG